MLQPLRVGSSTDTPIRSVLPGGWVDGWMGVNTGLRTACPQSKIDHYQFKDRELVGRANSLLLIFPWVISKERINATYKAKTDSFVLKGHNLCCLLLQ